MCTIRIHHLGVRCYRDDINLAHSIGLVLGGLSLGQRNLLDDSRLFQSRTGIRGAGALHKEDFVGRRVPDNSLVEQRIFVRLGEERQCRVGPNDLVELVIIDMEGLGLEGFLCDTGPYEQLCISCEHPSRLKGVV